jgi:hypothetical protein
MDQKVATEDFTFVKGNKKDLVVFENIEVKVTTLDGNDFDGLMCNNTNPSVVSIFKEEQFLSFPLSQVKMFVTSIS